jgi:predicted phage terminase large subunit-like protein
LKIQLWKTQHDFHACDAILRGFVGGRGCGKSIIGAYDLLRRAQPYGLYMVVAPTYAMLRDSSLRSFMQYGKRMRFIRRFGNQAMTAVLGNGAEILFRSADDPERLRGPSLNGAWMDEASLVKEEAYDNLIGCLRHEGEMGWLSATFTPKGRTHWTCRVFGSGLDEVALFKARSVDNPFLPAKFVTTLESQYSPLRAKQELEGEFVFMEGAEWPPEYFGKHLWFDQWPLPHKGQKVIALDSSKGKGGKTGDYSAFVMVQWHEGVLWVDADMDNARDPGVIADTAVELQARWKPHVFGVEEEFGGDVLGADIYRRARDRNILFPLVGVGTEGVNKVVRIRRLTSFLQNKQIRFKSGSPGAKLLVEQLENFPLGDHDDGPDALEMAIRILTEGGSLPQQLAA